MKDKIYGIVWRGVWWGGLVGRGERGGKMSWGEEVYEEGESVLGEKGFGGGMGGVEGFIKERDGEGGGVWGGGKKEEGE